MCINLIHYLNNPLIALIWFFTTWFIRFCFFKQLRKPCSPCVALLVWTLYVCLTLSWKCLPLGLLLGVLTTLLFWILFKFLIREGWESITVIMLSWHSILFGLDLSQPRRRPTLWNYVLFWILLLLREDSLFVFATRPLDKKPIWIELSDAKSYHTPINLVDNWYIDFYQLLAKW